MRLSTPVRFIDRKVTVHLTGDTLAVFDNHREIARRSQLAGHGTEHLVLDHCLEVLLCKPSTLDRSERSSRAPTGLPPSGGIGAPAQRKPPGPQLLQVSHLTPHRLTKLLPEDGGLCPAWSSGTNCSTSAGGTPHDIPCVNLTLLEAAVVGL